MDIKEQENRDSIRIVWNVMASTRVLQAKAAIPQALIYSPLQQNDPKILSYSPPKCKKCEALMNPYNRIVANKNQFICCICKQKNKLPQNYLKKQKYPLESTLQYSSYLLTEKLENIQQKMGYLLIVDICLTQTQLQSIKNSILQLINNLQDNYSIGLITYNKFISFYQLTSSNIKIHSFGYKQEYSTLDFAKILDFHYNSEGKIIRKFMNSLQECRNSFIQIIKGLKIVKKPSYKHQREARSIGQALNLALSFLELSSISSRIVFFCGGPATVGGGKVIDQDYKQQMRSIKQDFPQQSKKSRDFYRNLARKAKNKLIPIDSFIFSVEQTGFTEMSQLLVENGGLFIHHQQFNSEVFKQSFRKAYIGLKQYPPIQKASYASLNLKCSEEIGFQSQQKRQNNITIVLGDIDQMRAITIFYQLTQPNVNQAEAYYIQIRTIYRYPQNLAIKVQRITTIRRLFGDHTLDLIAGFDVSAAAALLAKLSIKKSITTPAEELRQWLDNIICKWAVQFATYNSGNPQTFKLAENIKLFPQFIYYLRRHSIIRRKGISLDQYTYICQIIKRQTVDNIILILQPALLQYTFQYPQMHPVPLDEKYLKPDSILLLDSFFNIVQWKGKNLQKLEDIHEKDSVQRILKNIQEDTQNLKNGRFPVPCYYLTCAGHSKERFIRSRLSARDPDEGTISDQVQMAAFTDKLIELVVSKKI